MMGLAPYGEPRYVDRIRTHLVDIKADGSELFGGLPRAPESPLDQRIADLARSVQVVTEDIMLAMARALSAETGESNLCLAGGVALNCVANARLLREGPFAEIWIQPAAGDAGGALGAALYASYQTTGVARSPRQADAMHGAYLGPGFSDAQVQQFLEQEGLPFTTLEENALIERVADLLAGGAVVGWFQGRMEFGPRALGNRSFLGDPRDAGMQRTLNLKIKSRESFRPFAPSVIAGAASRHFEFDRGSPYMLFVAPVLGARTNIEPQDGMLGRLAVPRSALPAVTHVDCSARLHTVEREDNPRFHLLLEAFGRRSGVPILINTSFNVRGEPIVCSPEDACRCFLATGADYLAIGTCLLQQQAMPTQHRLRTHATFEPD
jgi:carbamoyltransferase